MEVFVILFLLGVVAIILRGSWQMQRKIDRLEQYAVIITHFSHTISGLPKDEVSEKLNKFIKEHGGSVFVTSVEDK